MASRLGFVAEVCPTYSTAKHSTLLSLGGMGWGTGGDSHRLTFKKTSPLP